MCDKPVFMRARVRRGASWAPLLLLILLVVIGAVVASNFNQGEAGPDLGTMKAGDSWSNSIGMEFVYVPAGRYERGLRLSPYGLFATSRLLTIVLAFPAMFGALWELESLGHWLEGRGRSQSPRNSGAKHGRGP
jgi:hypothetical protein